MSGPRNTQFNPLPRWLLLLFLLQIKEEEKKEQKLSNSLHLVAFFFFKIKSFFIEGLVKWTEEENYNGGNVIGWIFGLIDQNMATNSRLWVMEPLRIG